MDLLFACPFNLEKDTVDMMQENIGFVNWNKKDTTSELILTEIRKDAEM